MYKSIVQINAIFNRRYIEIKLSTVQINGIFNRCYIEINLNNLTIKKLFFTQQHGVEPLF